MLSIALRVVSVVIATTAAAMADPRVVIVETPTFALPSLEARITLHAGGSIEVRTEAATDVSELAVRAPKLLAEHDATLVVWVDATDATNRTFTVYVAGRWPDRQLIELVRIGAETPASEIERIVSLKIVGLLDALLAPRPAAAVLGATAVAPTARWRLGIGVDTAIGGQDRAFAMGPVLRGERRWGTDWQPSLYVSGRTLLAGAVDAGSAITAIDEYSIAVGIDVARGPLFASAAIAGTLLHATVTTGDGRQGSATELLPVVELGVGARATIASLELTFGVRLEHAAIRQRFLVDDTVAADLGRARGVASLAVSLPLR